MINSTLFHEGTDAPSSAAESSAAPQKRRPGRPRIHPPKEKLTREELSLVRAEAGRKGGMKRNKGERAKRTTLFLFDTDKQTLSSFARSNGKTLLDGMADVANIVRQHMATKGDIVDNKSISIEPDDFAIVRRVMEAKRMSASSAMHLIIEFFREKVSL